jgi:hypothetical protein
MRRASARDRTEIPDVNGAVQVAVDVSSYAKDLLDSYSLLRSINVRFTPKAAPRQVRNSNFRFTLKNRLNSEVVAGPKRAMKRLTHRSKPNHYSITSSLKFCGER